jgi:hypothetical protein
MYSQLDAYCAELESTLKTLPETQRTEEIVEIRQHLEAMTEAYVELELTRAQAEHAAIQQFGSSRKIGRGIVRASASGLWRTLGLRTTVAGAALFGASCFMPALDIFGAKISGLTCAITVLIYGLPTDSLFGALYYHSIGVMNLWMLALPLLLIGPKARGRFSLYATVTTGAALLATPLWFGTNWHIGFYAWLASYWVIAAGSLMVAFASRARKRVIG